MLVRVVGVRIVQIGPVNHPPITVFEQRRVDSCRIAIQAHPDPQPVCKHCRHLRTLLRLSLQQTGRVIVVADAGDLAGGVELAAKFGPDIVVLDVIGMAASAWAAWIMYQFIEKPSQEMSSAIKFARRPEPAPLPAIAAATD